VGVKIKRTQNTPHHGLGLHGRAREKRPVKAGAHLPQRNHSGYDDSRGYEGSDHRRMGKISTPLPKAPVAKGRNAHGTGPDRAGGETLSAKKARKGRGGTATVQGKGLNASISHAAFEKLGA
jgi:hypothetical protein